MDLSQRIYQVLLNDSSCRDSTMSLLLTAITLILGGVIVVAQYCDSQPNDRLARCIKSVLPAKLSFSRLQLIAGLSIAAVSLVFQVVTARENQQKEQMLAQRAEEITRLRESVEQMRQEAAKESRQKEQMLAQQAEEITRLRDYVKQVRQENRAFSRRLVNLLAKNLRLNQSMAEAQLKPDGLATITILQWPTSQRKLWWSQRSAWSVLPWTYGMVSRTKSAR